VFLVPLILSFFWIKERIFSHYGKALISRRIEKHNRRKKFLKKNLKELLEPVPKVKEADVDELYKMSYLLKLKIDNLNQEIKKIEKEFEFNGSITLNLITTLER